MELLLLGLAIAAIAFGYLVKAPAPGGAMPGCIGILLGIVIVLAAVVGLIFF